jgi:hypothetical protein
MGPRYKDIVPSKLQDMNRGNQRMLKHLLDPANPFVISEVPEVLVVEQYCCMHSSTLVVFS